MTVRQGDTIAVWVSCGAASAVALQQTLRLYGDVATVRAINNPVVEEHEDNQRFMRDVGEWLGLKIETAVNDKYPTCSAEEVWERRKYVSGREGAPCTLELKKVARQQWEARNHTDWHVLGFTSDEKKRSDRFMLTERSNLLPVLVQSGITKSDCFDILKQAGVRLPDIYGLGYPNANCIGCVKATSPTYWNHVRRQHPEVFARRAEQSERIGARLVRVRNKRLFLSQLDPKAKGRPIKNTHIECGIFCEEKS